MLPRLASFPAALLVLGAACTKPEPADPTLQPEPEAEERERGADELAEATVLASPGGARLEVPAGWFATRDERVLRLEPPERDLDLWLVDVGEARAGEAIAAAWARVDPSFDREADDVVKPPAQGGWDELYQVTYETGADEGRVIVALARTRGDTTYVALLDGAMAAFQRRGAHLSQILGSQKPGDLQEESFADAEAVALDADRAAELDAFIGRAMKALEVPGAAVAVVQGGEIVFEDGYGVRDEGGAEVTPDTAFMIGSVTKALTSLMVAVGVDRGELSWSTPVVELLPGFSLADPEITEQIELQHTMCACTGLPRQDMEFLFRFAGATPRDRLAELATMTPTTGFGETFQYSNALVSAGGFAGARALAGGDSLQGAYRRAMNAAVLEPLGMESTVFRPAEATRRAHALPFGRDVAGTSVRIPLSYEDAVVSVAPAGGAWSTVGDLARYIQLELAGGALPSGDRLLAEDALLERRVPRVQIDEDTSYGLALTISRDRDLLTLGHGGNTLGFTSSVVMFPEHDLGIAVVANAQAANALTGVVERKLVELVLGGQPEADDNLAFAAERRREVAETQLARLSDPFDAGFADRLLGRYENAALGELTVSRDGDALWFDVGEWRARAERHHRGGTDTLMLVSPPVAGLPFLPHEEGLLLDVGQQQYLFARRD